MLSSALYRAVQYRMSDRYLRPHSIQGDMCQHQHQSYQPGRATAVSVAPAVAGGPEIRGGAQCFRHQPRKKRKNKHKNKSKQITNSGGQQKGASSRLWPRECHIKNPGKALDSPKRQRRTGKKPLGVAKGLPRRLNGRMLIGICWKRVCSNFKRLSMRNLCV